MNAWPALKDIFYDGWLIRLAEGRRAAPTRSTSSAPAARPLADKIEYLRVDLSRARQPAYFRILSNATPDLEQALEVRGYKRVDETATLYMNFKRTRPRCRPAIS